MARAVDRPNEEGMKTLALFAIATLVALVVALSGARIGTSSGGTGSEMIDAGGITSVSPSAFGVLKLHHQDGAELLDYTDPQHPTIASDGIYTFSMTAECLCAHERSGDALFILGIDNVSVDQQFSLTPSFFTPRASGSVTWRAHAGDEFGAVVANNAAKTLEFRPIMGLLQKIA